MATTLEPQTNFEKFLQQHLEQDLLRFTTAGSVDDGKSTLIGRLLHDTKSVYEDQLASIKKSRINRAAGPIDFSLLTDGLRAEREQGITIDVAYRYFSTSRRKFIIADTPGHEQYTRNMATGASTADLAIVLIDGSKGLLPQSRRHTYIASLLGIPHVVAAVNKMDLVQYDEARFRELHAQFLALANQLDIPSVQVIPISALEGDNVVHTSNNTPWYDGPTLLEYLETVPVSNDISQQNLRFPVQLVVRPDSTFRGFAGQIASGSLHPGDEVVALPSGRKTRVQSIVTYDGDHKAAFHPMSVTLKLEDEIDLSRGDMLVAPQATPHVSRHFDAMVVWMHEEPLVPGRTYLAKHTSRMARARVLSIHHKVDINTLQHLPANRLAMNDIASVRLETTTPLLFDSYRTNRSTGSLILIDPITNATVGAVMITQDAAHQHANEEGFPHATIVPALVLLPGRPQLAATLLQTLNQAGHRAIALDDDYIPTSGLVAAIRATQLAGAVAIVTNASLPADFATQVQAFLPQERYFQDNALPVEDAAALQALLSALDPRYDSQETGANA